MLAYVNIGAMYWYHHREHDIHLAVAPLFHVMAQQQSMCAPLVTGGSIVLLSRFVPDMVAHAIDYYGCTTWFAVPTMIIALLSLHKIGEFYLESLRCLVTGGSPISFQLIRQMQELFPNALVGESWARSETLPQGGAQTPFYRYKPGFVGTFQLNDAMIVDLETGGKEMPPNEKGELIVKGPTVMKGYWNNPEETKTALRDNWLYTGDIALMDEEGYVKLLGRKKEIIKCSGYNVFPADVEDLLLSSPGR